ncbi:hypothetical protein A9G09_11880 [Gilliamella sp. wkB292]|uniref:hypothetical protein n=1 Tax=Gilliamella sp. wkB292 TaxID=3120262 RepID=UPI00080EC445|nr:hypothetical protein [Gilliamella apicola]OCG10804.1 hypothetical protein A9G09_11880 [Gilliamella apicola]
MAIFKRVTKEYIQMNYTHYALAYGIYPIYIGKLEHESPTVEVRNWFPIWGLTLLDYIVQSSLSFFGKENIFMFKITGEIKCDNDGFPKRHRLKPYEESSYWQRLALSQLDVAIRDLSEIRSNPEFPQWVDNWICDKLDCALRFIESSKGENGCKSMARDAYNKVANALLVLDMFRYSDLYKNKPNTVNLDKYIQSKNK